MSADITFSSELPDIQRIMGKFQKLDTAAWNSIQTGLEKGGNQILSKQKALIKSVSPELANALTVGKVYRTKKNVQKIQMGYAADKFSGNEDSIGKIGMVFEFGRPGKSKGRNKQRMRYTKNGKTTYRLKGKIDAVPHVRRGFDLAKNAANAALITEFERAVKNAF